MTLNFYLHFTYKRTYQPGERHRTTPTQSVFAGYPVDGGPTILVVREYPVPDGMAIYFIEPSGVDNGVMTWVMPVNAARRRFPTSSKLSW